MTSEIEFLKDMSLLKGLSEAQLADLKGVISHEHFASNEVVLKEGDLTTDLYLIAEGEVSVLKWDEEHRTQMPVGRLLKGEMFGEMSFMDGSPRSSTIKTIKETELLKLSKDKLQSGSKVLQGVESTLFANIAVANITRLRDSNKMYVKNLRSYLKSFQYRQDVGQFLILQLLLIGICLFISRFFTESLWGYLPWILAAIPIYWVIKKNDYDWEKYGLTTHNLLTVCLVALALFGFIWVGDYFFSTVFRLNPSESWMLSLRPFFSKSLPFSSFAINVLFYALYCFAYEFIARGVIQTSVQEFLSDEAGYKSILVTSGLLLLAQISLGIFSSGTLFISNLFLGFLFLVQKSIWGVFLVHFLTGLALQ